MFFALKLAGVCRSSSEVWAFQKNLANDVGSCLMSSGDPSLQGPVFLVRVANVPVLVRLLSSPTK